MRGRRTLYGSLLIVSVAAVASAAGAHHPQDGDVLELNSDVVLVPMVVQAPVGKGVVDLTAADFSVADGAVSPEIAFFQRDSAPIDAVLLVDRSASTGATLDVLERSALAFVKSLRPEDAFTVFTFSDKPEVLVDWSNDPKRVERTLSHAEPGGFTLLNMSSIVAMRAAFNGRPHDRRRALLVFTDGIDTGSGFYTMDKVGAEAITNDVTLYVVASNRLASDAIDDMIEHRLVPESSWADYRGVQATLHEVEGPLSKAANRTGGRVLFPSRRGDLSSAFAEVAEELRSRYLLGFYIPEGASNGFHQISVTCKRAGVTVRARNGYYRGVSEQRR